jgi:hypothetical protein
MSIEHLVVIEIKREINKETGNHSEGTLVRDIGDK